MVFQTYDVTVTSLVAIMVLKTPSIDRASKVLQFYQVSSFYRVPNKNYRGRAQCAPRQYKGPKSPVVIGLKKSKLQEGCSCWTFDAEKVDYFPGLCVVHWRPVDDAQDKEAHGVDQRQQQQRIKSTNLQMTESLQMAKSNRKDGNKVKECPQCV